MGGENSVRRSRGAQESVAMSEQRERGRERVRERDDRQGLCSREPVVTCDNWSERPPCCPAGLSCFACSAAAPEEETRDIRPNVSVAIRRTPELSTNGDVESTRLLDKTVEDVEIRIIGCRITFLFLFGLTRQIPTICFLYK